MGISALNELFRYKIALREGRKDAAYHAGIVMSLLYNYKLSRDFLPEGEDFILHDRPQGGHDMFCRGRARGNYLASAL